MYMPFVWFIGWIMLMYFLVPQFQNMDVNPFLYIQAAFAVLIYYPTWFVIALGIVGYFLQKK